MRYTETSHKIENPADLIRVVSSCIILSLFRMVNEYSKRVMFLGKEKLRVQLLVAVCINAAMLLGEFFQRFVIGDRVIVILETHFIPLIISLIVISTILVVVNRSTSLSFEISAKPDLEEFESDEPVGFEEPVAFTESSPVGSMEDQFDSVESATVEVPSAKPSFSEFAAPKVKPNPYMSRYRDDDFDYRRRREEDEYRRRREEDDFDYRRRHDDDDDDDFDYRRRREEEDYRRRRDEDDYRRRHDEERRNLFREREERRLESVINGKDLDAITAEIENTNNSLKDIMGAIGSRRAPRAHDYPETSPEMSHEINKNINSDRFHVADGPEDDLLDDTDELESRFNRLFNK